METGSLRRYRTYAAVAKPQRKFLGSTALVGVGVTIVKCFCVLPCVRIARVGSQVRAKVCTLSLPLRGAEAQYIYTALAKVVSQHSI
jgi:hypothetical protein